MGRKRDEGENGMREGVMDETKTVTTKKCWVRKRARESTGGERERGREAVLTIRASGADVSISFGRH